MLNSDAELRNEKVDLDLESPKKQKFDAFQVRTEEKPKLRWVLSVGIVISSMIFNGTIYGFTSPALLSMKQSASQQNQTTGEIYSTFIHSKQNDIVLTDSEASWVSSISSLGFILGGIVCGLVMKLLGKKYSSIFGLGSSYIIGYALIALAPSKEYIYAGRFFGGICQGFCNCLTTLYTLELCKTSRQKALCGVLLSVLGNMGTLLTYILGVFLSWRELALSLLILSVPYILGVFIWVPETNPSTNKPMDNNNPKVWFKKFQTQDNNEMVLFSDVNSNIEQETPKRGKILCKMAELCSCYKPVMTGLSLMFFIQFGGYNVVSFYAATILTMDAKEMAGGNITDPFQDEDMNTDRTALWAAVGVAVAGLVGVLLGVYLVHRGLKRKHMLLVSSLGVSITFEALGTYLLLQTTGDSNVTTLWVTTIALISQLLLFNLGYGCLGFPVAAEILPEALRSKGLPLITFSAGVFGFLNGKSYLDLKYFFGSGITFIIYGTINLAGGIFIFTCLPDI